MSQTSSKRLTIAAILAGGRGTRVGGECPKQYIEIGGKTVLEHTVEAFLASPEVDKIVLIVAEDKLSDGFRLVSAHGEAWSRVAAVGMGGAERIDSTIAALNLADALAAPRLVDAKAPAASAFEGAKTFAGADFSTVNLLVHDAARPVVTPRLIADVVRALADADYATPVLPLRDSLLSVRHDGTIALQRRDEFRLIQTPQGFRADVLADAVNAYLARTAAGEAFAPTDDFSLVAAMTPQRRGVLVAGERTNIKLTYADDLPQIARLLGEKEPSHRGALS